MQSAWTLEVITKTHDTSNINSPLATKVREDTGTKGREDTGKDAQQSLQDVVYLFF